MTHFFTIICEFKGGTYTEQYKDEHATRTFERWAEKFKNGEVLTQAEKKILAGEVHSSLIQQQFSLWPTGASRGSYDPAKLAV